MPKAKTDTRIPDRAAELQDLQHVAADLAAASAALVERLRMARGSRDVTAAARAATASIETTAAPVPKSKLYEDVRRTLEDAPHTFRSLCTALQIDHEHENSLKSVLVRLPRDGHRLVNLGNGARAIWWIDVHGRIDEIAAERHRAITSARK